MERTRIVVRGAAGLLGSRLIRAIGRTEEMYVTAGIVRPDTTLERMCNYVQFGGPEAPALLPPVLYLDASPDDRRQLERQWGQRCRFEPLSSLTLSDAGDVVIDAASTSRDDTLEQQYQQFSGPIILQDGEYPRGRLIASPLMAPPQGGNRYRQGGCFLSGIVPVLAAFRDVASVVRLHLVMQHDGRERDFLIAERLNSFRLADEHIPRIEGELRQLFPDTDLAVESIIQIPGLLHYAVTIRLETNVIMERADVVVRLRSLPRVRMLPESIGGTFEVHLARATDDRIPPILVFERTITAARTGGGSTIGFTLALYYRTLAVLPNIDAVRILARGTDSLAAMRQTDRDMGFVLS